jgi:hypothetical protein
MILTKGHALNPSSLKNLRRWKGTKRAGMGDVRNQILPKMEEA